MYNTSKNKQVFYSLTTLSDSLFELLQDRDINDITITEVCANSDITRKTFYRNCEELEDLITFKIDTELNQVIKEINWASNNVYLIVLSFFSCWNERKEFLKLIHKKKLFSKFSERLIKLVTMDPNYTSLTAILGSLIEPRKKFYYDSFIMGGSAQLLETWVSQDFDLSAEELTEVYLLFKH